MPEHLVEHLGHLAVMRDLEADVGRAEERRAEEGRAEEGRAEDGRAEERRAEEGRDEEGRDEEVCAVTTSRRSSTAVARTSWGPERSLAGRSPKRGHANDAGSHA